MACPYFIPTERIELGWQHPERLPLGAGWSGVCGAPGQMLARPNDEEMREGCNLGHARCHRLPSERAADSVRFVAKEGDSRRILLSYVFERGCLPAGQGLLEYDMESECWLQACLDEKLQRQAECFLSVWRSYRDQARGASSSS